MQPPPPRRPSRQPPQPPWRGLTLTGYSSHVIIAAAIATARCRRRRLDAPTNLSVCGAVASQLHWLPCNQPPPHSTGTVSPATPCNNQDVEPRSSWDDLRKNWKSANYSKNIFFCEIFGISRKQYLVLDDQLQQFLSNTFSTTELATTSVVLPGVSKICNTLSQICTWSLLIAANRIIGIPLQSEPNR